MADYGRHGRAEGSTPLREPGKHRLADAGLIPGILHPYTGHEAAVRARGRQRTDSTHVLAAVRRLSRVELVAETMRMALEALAQLDEVWLAGFMPVLWADRYGRSARHERQPTGATAVREYVEQVGADGIVLLRAVYGPTGPVGGPGTTAVEVLRQVGAHALGWAVSCSPAGYGLVVAVRIDRIQITNHSRIPDLRLSVRRHAVIVGANDVGKTSILRLLQLSA